MTAAAQRPDYGIDAPKVVGTLGGIGIVALFLGTAAPLPQGIESALLWMGGSLFLTAVVMVLSSKFGKLKAADSLLDSLDIKPGDHVLDVGCGHGLLLFRAARRATTGRAVGIDLWSTTDQFRNSRDATLANAIAEGVAERTEVYDGDMRSLPFEADTFDVVVSSLAIHNLGAKEDRDRAVHEIARVLRSGGRAGIIDIAHAGRYAEIFRADGLQITRGPVISSWIFPPARFVSAIKQ